MPLGNDDAARQFDRSPGTDEGDTRRPLEMTGQGNGSLDAQAETVGLADFDLALRADRAEDADMFKSPFRSFQRHRFISGELSGLTELALWVRHSPCHREYPDRPG